MDGWRFVCKNQDDVPLDRKFIKSLTKMPRKNGETCAVIPDFFQSRVHLYTIEKGGGFSNIEYMSIVIDNRNKAIKLSICGVYEYTYEQFMATLHNLQYGSGNYIHPNELVPPGELSQNRFGKTKSARNA